MEIIGLRPYYKAGSDLINHIGDTGDLPDAFIAWAKHLEAAAQDLRKIAEIVRFENQASIQADGVFVSIDGLSELGDRRIRDIDIVAVEQIDDELLESD